MTLHSVLLILAHQEEAKSIGCAGFLVTQNDIVGHLFLLFTPFAPFPTKQPLFTPCNVYLIDSRFFCFSVMVETLERKIFIPLSHTQESFVLLVCNGHEGHFRQHHFFGGVVALSMSEYMRYYRFPAKSKQELFHSVSILYLSKNEHNFLAL